MTNTGAQFAKHICLFAHTQQNIYIQMQT